ncbi:hypothetical protein PCORN_12352 [Listeria cornellensis FSL F6-0969]|uniref:Uncharacterized protein n=1 Tax=Listeria cornellensis FSL F6-0969 TaxID=1265820 RepID=W7BPY8_9LIST|nr:hypothetical protein PCORN_12352 [Listeria cornellensis FSL F6-0969]
MHQDTSYIENANLSHMQQDQATQATHEIQVEKASRLRTILGSTAHVNSFHHQAVDKLGTGLKITATAPDGVVEAIEKEGAPFVVGVQWHPELIAERDASMQHLFREFVKNAELGALKQFYNVPANFKRKAILR